MARAFVTRTIGKAETKRERFDEVPLRMQTLWFFPDAERAILIFHGSLPVTTDDGADPLGTPGGALQCRACESEGSGSGEQRSHERARELSG